jgi:protein-S-isoprenylcysteine O-methyltransferase Ste14
MSARGEDLLGKSLMILAFVYLAITQIIGLIFKVRAAMIDPSFILPAAAQALSLFFVLLMVVMTLRRSAPTSIAIGIEPRLAAISGTFLLMVLVWLPPGKSPFGVQVLGTLLLLAGTAGSIYCLRYLGRSFSIMAAARELVTHGPYGVVRHPLYVAEGFSTLGIIILHWSWPAILIGAAQLALQWRRMQHEERVLRAAFPVYADYALRVPMVVPRAMG